MKSSELLMKIGDVDDEFIEAAASMEKRKTVRTRRGIVYALASAAAMLLAIGAALFIKNAKSMGNMGGVSAFTNDTANPITNPTQTAVNTLQPSASPVAGGENGFYWPHPTMFPTEFPTAGSMAIDDDLLGGRDHSYCIYNGRYYERIAVRNDISQLVGEKIGEVKLLVDGRLYRGGYAGGGIDESGNEVESVYVEPMEPVEHTGGLLGAIYALSGYPEDKLVCQLAEDGVYLYLCHPEGGYERGSELFEDAFRAREKFQSLAYWGEEVSYPGVEGTEREYVSIDPALYGNRIEAFLDALDAGEWIEAEQREVPTVDMIEGYLHLELDGGMYLDLTLLNDASVAVHDMGYIHAGRVIKIDEAAAEGIAELIRGKYSFRRVTRHDAKSYSLEELISDPMLGKGVPKRLPEGVALIGASISKFSPDEEKYLEGSGERAKSDPTRQIELILAPEHGGGDERIRMIIIPTEYEGELNGFFTERGESRTVPLEAFTNDDLVIENKGDDTIAAAFIGVDGVSVMISAYITPNDGEVPSLILRLVSAIG